MKEPYNSGAPSVILSPSKTLFKFTIHHNKKNHKIKGITKSSKKIKRSIIVNPETITT